MVNELYAHWLWLPPAQVPVGHPFAYHVPEGFAPPAMPPACQAVRAALFGPIEEPEAALIGIRRALAWAHASPLIAWVLDARVTYLPWALRSIPALNQAQVTGPEGLLVFTGHSLARRRIYRVTYDGSLLTVTPRRPAGAAVVAATADLGDGWVLRAAADAVPGAVWDLVIPATAPPEPAASLAILEGTPALQELLRGEGAPYPQLRRAWEDEAAPFTERLTAAGIALYRRLRALTGDPA